jgi:acyl-coenzyme A thioesterase PaaI-like protein
MDSPGTRLLALWRRLTPLPFGRHLFAWAFGRTVPYSGSVKPLILALEPGFVQVRLPDRRANRNHLGSVHAIALANVAELASGLAMTTALPPAVRGIVVHLAIEYVKKARGPLLAEAHVTVPELSGRPEEHDFVSTITDGAGDVVARATVRWRLGPSK